ncbi:hypothetical protein LCGC14_1656790, partial [marine sediment metagenome]
NMGRNNSIKSIVYASDFEEDDVLAIQRLVKIAEPLNAEIKIVHVATDNAHDQESHLVHFIEKVKQKVGYQNIQYKIVSYPNVYDGLRNYINFNNVDILVLLEREQHGFFNTVFHRDLNKKMESHVQIPVLSINQVYL